MGQLTFNGVSTKDLDIVIQAPPTYTFPERDISTAHIPGRNGDLVIDNNCYKNVTRSYVLGMGFRNKSSEAYSEHSSKILEWLTSARTKYARLVDTYDPKVYRMAMFNMNGSFTNIYDGALSFTVEFQCKPQRYLVSGEEEVEYSMKITNPSIYDALPKITIEGLGGVSLSGDILMFSVYNAGDTVSSVTISKKDINKIVIDSDMQTVNDENQNDLNPYIGLNGKFFPMLKAGDTNFQLIDYGIIEEEVRSYESLIKFTQSVIKSEYKNHKALEDQFQEKYSIPSYKSLVEKNTETYSAESVQSMVMDEREEYTFISFNELITQGSESYAFTGSLSDNPIESRPDWLELIQYSDNSLSIIAKYDGYYMIKGIDKKIRYVRSGEAIRENISYSTTTVVQHYPGEKNDLRLNYEDCPEWVRCIIEYDEDNSPITLKYVTTKTGYYWTDKSWLFGKAEWNYHTESQPVVLNELKWSTTKSAFVSTSGLVTSTTNTYKYGYIENLPQYKNIEVTEERNGRTITKVVSKVHFTIEDISSPKTLTKIKITTIEGGYYKVLKGDKEIKSWKLYNASEDIISDYSGTDEFTILRIEQPPVYDSSDKKTWPSWLSPIPYKDGPDITGLAPDNIWFMVLEHGWYRYSTVDPETEEEIYSEWTELNGTEQYVAGKQPFNETFSISMVKEDPEGFEFTNDRVFTNEAGDMSSEPPSWLKYEIFIEIILEGEEDKTTCYRDVEHDELDKGLYAWTYERSGDTRTIYTKGFWNPNFEDDVYELQNDETEVVVGAVAMEAQIRYRAKMADGQDKAYYKWDSGSAWISREDNDELLVTTGIGESTIYYMQDIPKYDGTIEGYGPYELFEIEVDQDYNGNPNSLTFRVKEGKENYFRVNNNSDWIKYKSGDPILTSKVMENNYVRHLVEKTDITNNVSIKVIPNWWVL